MKKIIYSEIKNVKSGLAEPQTPINIEVQIY